MTEFPRKAGEWTELSRETVYENPWIEVQHSAILNPNGGEGIYGKVHFKNLRFLMRPFIWCDRFV